MNLQDVSVPDLAVFSNLTREHIVQLQDCLKKIAIIKRDGKGVMSPFDKTNKIKDRILSKIEETQEIYNNIMIEIEDRAKAKIGFDFEYEELSTIYFNTDKAYHDLAKKLEERREKVGTKKTKKENPSFQIIKGDA